MNQLYNGNVQGGYGGASMPPMAGQFEVKNIWSQPGDERRTAIFYVKADPDAKLSEAAGYTVTKDVVYCKHQEVGDNLQVPDVPATDYLKRRYPQAWAMFEQGRGGEHIGMPLDLLFPGQPSLVRNLQAHGVFTVEELSNIGAEGQRHIGMGADQWSKKAAQFLEQAKDTAAITKANAVVERQNEQIAALTAQVEKLMEAMGRQFAADPVTAIAAAKRVRPSKAPFSIEAEPVDEEVI